jgi:hypothetical protein
VVIATTPHSGATGVSLERDITLVKAALLYADVVELVSPGAAMLGSVASIADRGEVGLIQLLRSLDPATLHALGGPTPDQMRTVLPLLGLLRDVDPAQLRAIPGAEEFAEQLAIFNEGMTQSAQQFSDVTEELLLSAGAEELTPAIDAGVLTLSTAALAEDTTGTGDMLVNFLGIVKAHLANPRSRLMFDDDLAGLIRAMIREASWSRTTWP